MFGFNPTTNTAHQPTKLSCVTRPLVLVFVSCDCSVSYRGTWPNHHLVFSYCSCVPIQHDDERAALCNFERPYDVASQRFDKSHTVEGESSAVAATLQGPAFNFHLLLTLTLIECSGILSDGSSRRITMLVCTSSACSCDTGVGPRFCRS